MNDIVVCLATAWAVATSDIINSYSMFMCVAMKLVSYSYKILKKLTIVHLVILISGLHCSDVMFSHMGLVN